MNGLAAVVAVVAWMEPLCGGIRGSCVFGPKWRFALPGLLLIATDLS